MDHPVARPVGAKGPREDTTEPTDESSGVMAHWTALLSQRSYFTGVRSVSAPHGPNTSRWQRFKQFFSAGPAAKEADIGKLEADIRKLEAENRILREEVLPFQARKRIARGQTKRSVSFRTI